MEISTQCLTPNVGWMNVYSFCFVLFCFLMFVFSKLPTVERKHKLAKIPHIFSRIPKGRCCLGLSSSTELPLWRVFLLGRLWGRLWKWSESSFPLTVGADCWGSLFSPILESWLGFSNDSEICLISVLNWTMSMQLKSIDEASLLPCITQRS